jgi:hypothetical protein
MVAENFIAKTLLELDHGLALNIDDLELVGKMVFDG